MGSVRARRWLWVLLGARGVAAFLIGRVTSPAAGGVQKSERSVFRSAVLSSRVRSPRPKARRTETVAGAR
jgi:hypothetical protein